MAAFQHPIVLPFEKDYDAEFTREQMRREWTATFFYSIVYIVLIFGIKWTMKKRTPFRLTPLLFFWNATLAIFSIVVFVRTAPELIFTISRKGFRGSVCDNRYFFDDPVAGFWSYLFVLAKLPELGDTIFIVLRKNPLIFLHWYHHIFTMIYSWYSYSSLTANSRWFIVMNSLIHSVMYTYYGLKAIRVAVPKTVSVFITSFQTIQMGIGSYICFKSWQYLSTETGCAVPLPNVVICSVMYLSYFVLFSRFFYKTYICKNKIQ